MSDHFPDAGNMVRPVRLRLSRKAGFNLQAHSLAVNGLPAVSVARGPGRKWGNPFPQKELTWIAVAMGFRGDKRGRIAAAVELYRRWMGLEGQDGPLADMPPSLGALTYSDGSHQSVDDAARGFAAAFAAASPPDITLPDTPDPRELRGKNLACWCPLDGSPCHADVLLELANGDGSPG